MNRCVLAGPDCVISQGTRKKCFACGESVCGGCSRIMPWYRFSRVRVCERCREDHERCTPSVRPLRS